VSFLDYFNPHKPIPGDFGFAKVIVWGIVLGLLVLGLSGSVIQCAGLVGS
jgi:hypothetical protein